jgi:hypothetical protein
VPRILARGKRVLREDERVCREGVADDKQPDVETFKVHLEWKRSYLPPERFEIRRAALRWDFQEGRLRMKAASRVQAVPPPERPSQKRQARGG